MDHQSDYKRFRELVPEADVFSRPIPRAVLWWINNPCPDDDLGRKIVLELKANGVDVLEYMC